MFRQNAHIPSPFMRTTQNIERHHTTLGKARAWKLAAGFCAYLGHKYAQKTVRFLREIDTLRAPSEHLEPVDISHAACTRVAAPRPYHF